MTLTIEIETDYEWDAIWALVADLKADPTSVLYQDRFKKAVAYAMRNRST